MESVTHGDTPARVPVVEPSKLDDSSWASLRILIGASATELANATGAAGYRRLPRLHGPNSVGSLQVDTAGQTLYFNKFCEDVDDPNCDEWRWLQHQFQGVSPTPPVSCTQIITSYNSSCIDPSMLGTVVRALCPVSCGCDSLVSWNPMAMIQYGCPEVCLALRTYRNTPAQAGACQELPPQELLKVEGWVNMSQAFRVIAPEVSDQWRMLPNNQSLPRVKAADLFADKMLELGCGVVNFSWQYFDRRPAFLQFYFNPCAGFQSGYSLYPFKGLQNFCPHTCPCDHVPNPWWSAFPIDTYLCPEACPRFTGR